MSNAEIPQIRDLPASVLAGVGEGVQVFFHEEDLSSSVPTLRSSHEMVNDVVTDMFRREGVRPNRDLELLCILAARIAVAKLASSSGFRVEFGDWKERNPHEIIEVKLRAERPTVRDAEVTKIL
jgi:hypothetical protein